MLQHVQSVTTNLVPSWILNSLRQTSGKMYMHVLQPATSDQALSAGAAENAVTLEVNKKTMFFFKWTTNSCCTPALEGVWFSIVAHSHEPNGTHG